MVLNGLSLLNTVKSVTTLIMDAHKDVTMLEKLLTWRKQLKRKENEFVGYYVNRILILQLRTLA